MTTTPKTPGDRIVSLVFQVINDDRVISRVELPPDLMPELSEMLSGIGYTVVKGTKLAVLAHKLVWGQDLHSIRSEPMWYYEAIE